MPRYKKRRPSSTEGESDNDLEESTEMDDHNEFHVASSTVQVCHSSFTQIFGNAGCSQNIKRANSSTCWKYKNGETK